MERGMLQLHGVPRAVMTARYKHILQNFRHVGRTLKDHYVEIYIVQNSDMTQPHDGSVMRVHVGARPTDTVQKVMGALPGARSVRYLSPNMNDHVPLDLTVAQAHLRLWVVD